MKKLLGIVLALASLTFVGSAASASPSSEAAGQERIREDRGREDRGRHLGWYKQRERIRDDRGRHLGWNKQRTRVFTQTRIVQRGRHRFRETYQVISRPNGRTETRLISRVRLV